MRVIVTTTINPVTEAIERFDSKSEWHLVVIGDKKKYRVFRRLFKDFKYSICRTWMHVFW